MSLPSIQNHQLAPSTLIIAVHADWDLIWREISATIHQTDRWSLPEWQKPPTVAELRDLHRHVAQTPRKEYKMAAIPFADMLSRETANSLLKVLEEPPAYFCTILFAESEAVLPTIRSRVQVIRLSESGSGEVTTRQRLATMLARYNVQSYNERKQAERLLHYIPLVHPTIQLPLLEEAFQPES